MVLDAEVYPVAVRVEVGPDVVIVEVEADVPVELPVLVIPGVALPRAPDLLGRLHVAPEGCDGARAVDGREDAVARPGGAEEDAVRVGEEVLDADLLEELVDTGGVAAFGKPDAPRPAAEMPLVMIRRDLELCSGRVPVRHERQEAVCRGAGDDLEFSLVLEFPEGGDERAVVPFQEYLPRPGQSPVVHERELVELGRPARPLDLPPREIYQLVQVAQVTVLEERVGHHGDERRREGHGDPEIDALLEQPVEHLDEWDIGLGQRLEEPVLLEKLLVLGMPHVGEVGMEDEREIALRAVRHLVTGSLLFDFLSTLVSIVRSSIRSADTAVTGISIFPSGRAKRIEKLPSPRSLTSLPWTVRRASGSVAP